MAEESDKAKQFASDWILTSFILDGVDTGEIDNVVQQQSKLVTSRSSYIDFLENFKFQLDQLDLLSGDAIRKSIGEQFDTIRTSIETELRSYEAVKSVESETHEQVNWNEEENRISLYWYLAAVSLNEEQVKDIDDFVKQADVSTESEYIKFLSDLSVKFLELKESLAGEMKEETVNAFNEFRNELNEEFERVGLPPLKVEFESVDVHTEDHPEEQQEYSEGEIVTPEPEEAERMVAEPPQFAGISRGDYNKLATNVEVEWVTESFNIDEKFCYELDKFIMERSIESRDDYIEFLTEVGHKLTNIVEKIDIETYENNADHLNHFLENLNAKFTGIGLPALPPIAVDVQKQALPEGERPIVDVKTKQPDMAEISHAEERNKAGEVSITWMRDSERPESPAQDTDSGPDNPEADSEQTPGKP